MKHINRERRVTFVGTSYNNVFTGNLMYALYKINADELDSRFLESLKTQLQYKVIKISVCEAEESSEDETAYLLRPPANRKRLLASIANVEAGNTLVNVDIADWQGNKSLFNLPLSKTFQTGRPLAKNRTSDSLI